MASRISQMRNDPRPYPQTPQAQQQQQLNEAIESTRNFMQQCKSLPSQEAMINSIL